jgi:hypothetical protein
MGKLRFEPKVKPLVDDDTYQIYKENLLKAQSGSIKNHVFWDLDKGENPTKARKIFLYVAQKEGIVLNVRADRKAHCLRFGFSQGKPVSGRMTADDSKNRILKALNAANHPLKKAEIVKESGISTSTWNLRIKELLASNKVKREGSGRDTKYLSV